MRSFLFLLFISFSNSIIGQNILFLDSETKSPIENVNIKGGVNGVISDKNGIANINLFEKNLILKITHIGYTEQNILCSKIKDTVYLNLNSLVLPTVNFVKELRVLSQFKPSVDKLKLKSNEHELTHVTSVLKTKTSVTVQKSQVGSGSPNFRGFEANRLLLIVDDISLNNTIFRSGHVQASAMINPFFVESINIVTGPASVVYGNGAMGSAIVFKTLSNNKNVVSLVQKFESSSNTIITNYKNRFSIKDVGFLSAFSIKKAENLKMGKNRNHGYNDWGIGYYTKNEEQLFTSFSQVDLLQKIKFKLSDFTVISLNSQYGRTSKIDRFDKLNDIVDGVPKYSDWYYGPSERISQIITVNNLKNKHFYDSFKIKSSVQKITESRHHKKNNENLTSNRYEKLMIYDLDINFNKKIKIGALNYGAGARHEYLKSNADLTSFQASLPNTTRYPNGGTRSNNLYLYSQIGLIFSDHFSAYLGGRFNSSMLSALFADSPLNSLANFEITNKTNSFVGSVSIKHEPNKTSQLIYSFYTGFRNPNTDEIGKLFSKNDMFVIVPNANLKPEKSKNIEISFNKKLFSNITLGINTYITKIDDAIERGLGDLNGDTMITYDGEEMRIQMNKNISKAIIKGVSFNIEYKYQKHLTIHTNFSVLKGENDFKEPLAHIPPLKSSLNIDYFYNKHSFNFCILYNSKKLAEEYDLAGVDNLEEATIDGSPSWYTLNILYRNQFAKDFSLSFGVENILDIHYKPFASGIAASGRNFTLSLSYNLHTL